jgi:chromosome partitioning protein
MRIITVTSQKGGSGKTTLTGHLAVAAEQQGAGPVALIDTDPQGSLSDWWNARESNTPAFVKTSLATLENDLSELKQNGFRLVFIDTPPTITHANHQIISKSDFIIVPTRPSPHDLRAVGPTIDLVERAGKPMMFAVNCATMRAKLTGEAAIALSQHGTVAPTIIHNRQDFAASMIDGRTVQELNAKSRSAAEIFGLWDYVQSRLARLPVKTAFRSLHQHKSGFGNKNGNARPSTRETPSTSVHLLS